MIQDLDLGTKVGEKKDYLVGFFGEMRKLVEHELNKK